MKVLVDGENLRHQIASILIDAGLLPKTHKNNFFKFRLREFLQDILGEKDLEISYYTTKIKQPYFKIPKKLSDSLEAISKEHRRWIAYLSNQNIKIIKAGHLKVRESSTCVHCGKKTLVLQEKGVDVRVATDLLILASNKVNIVLASSDSDIVPALQVSKRLGVEVNYICPANQLNRSVASQVSYVTTFSKKKVVAYFNEVKQ